MLKFWKKKPADEMKAGDSATVAPESVIETEVPSVVEVEHDAPAADSAPAGNLKRSWRDRLSGSGFARGLSSLFARNPVLDDALLDELETCLITADVGVANSSELVERLRARVTRREFADANALLAALRTELVERLNPVERPVDVGGRRPFVLLTVGVNGVGKTTTIGKLARRYTSEGRSVLLAAGDTFRAAAVEQLRAWG
jgi:fused signal recognition particle receptor